MENQEPKSKWDDLARELGAEIPPEAPQVSSSDAAEPDRQLAGATKLEREARVKVAPPPAKRSATDWNALNSELGLEPPPPEAPAAMAPTEPGVVPTPVRSEEGPRREERPPAVERLRRGEEDRPPRRDQEPSRSADVPRASDRSRSRPRSRDGGRPRDDEGPREESRSRGASKARDESHSGDEPRPRQESRPRDQAESRDDSRSRESRSSDRSRSDSRRGRSRRHDERDDDSLAKSEANDMIKAERRAAEAEEAARQEERVERAPEEPKAASVSLWHKIFGLPTEQSAKLAGAEEDEKESGEVIESETFAKEATWSGFTQADEGTLEGITGSAEAREVREGDAEETSDDRGRRRPRRRRRGGRKASDHREGERVERKPARRRDHDDDIVEESDDEFGFDDEFGGAPIRTTDSARPEFDLDDDDDDLEDDETRGEGSPSTRSAAHRGIPSWQDAIGAIVDLNLQSRSQRRQSSGAQGRSGAQRGRPRGRRKKKS